MESEGESVLCRTGYRWNLKGRACFAELDIDGMTSQREEDARS
jgi:hypothetical protein